MKRLKPTDTLSAPEFLGRNPPAYLTIKVLYRCRRCGNRVETHIPTSAVASVKCGSRMKPVGT